MRARKGWQRIISPDLRIKSITPWGSGKEKKSHTLMPGELATAKLHRQFTLPDRQGQSPLPLTSTRSILARLGVEVHNSQGRIPETLMQGKTPSEVMLLHHGEVPVKMRRGNRITRMYFPQLTKPLRHAEIQKMRKSGELVLGKDCKVHSNGLVEIRVIPVVYEIPPDAKKLLAKENWLTGSKRNAFMQLLKRVKKPVRIHSNHIILTETLPVKLPKDVAMFFQRTTDGSSVHIQSHLIDPGFKGPIAMELLGFHEKKSRPDTVLAWLCRAE
ncbi:MAG: hypothetical protein Q7R70_05255 [Candidatus Diapherotrites archaeon]|nr:hypothetical protein [Candidatus Diapherotrites archaeon]